MPSIVIFSLDGCFHCKNLKNSLNKLNIPFIDVEIGQNQKLWDQELQKIYLN